MRPDPPTKSNAWKWWIAGVLFLATVLTYLDRQTVSLCEAKICDEFHLSNEQYGQLLSTFRWAYAPTHVLAGWLADHFSIRIIYALAVGVWSAAGAGAALVVSFGQLRFTRGVLGVGEAFNWPCATRIVANTLSPEDRGLGSGIFNSGGAVGALLAPWVITPIAGWLGWRWAFFIVGVVGFSWIALWMIVTRRGRPSHEVAGRPRPKTSTPGPRRPTLAALRSWARETLLQPAFWLLVVIGCSANPSWYFITEWTTKYLHDQRGMQFIGAGLVTTPVFLGADLGNLLSGGLIKYLTTRGWSLRKARGTTLAAATLLVLPMTFVSQIHSVWITVGIFSLAATGLMSLLANYTACQQDLSFANVGIVAGILGMSCNIFSAVVNPIIGRYVDRTHSYALIYLLVGLLPLVTLGGILAFDAIIWSRNGKARHDPTA
jgi:ACS family hexuronate transporter-like MFS transporter